MPSRNKPVGIMFSKKILFATDYSEASNAALQVATNLARRDDATLLIVHVSESEQYPVGELFDEEPEPDEAEVDELKSVVPGDARVKYEHRLPYGDLGGTERVKPADEILKLAEKEHPETIVVGSHGRSGLVHALMGGVAESVSRGAACRVIIIKPSNGRN